MLGLLRWSPLASTVMALCVLVEALIRGGDYFLSPDRSSDALTALNHVGIPHNWLAWIFVILSTLGLVGILFRKWGGAVIAHGGLAGVFATLAVVVFIPAMHAGYGFRVGCTFLIFAVLHAFCADACFDEWWGKRGRRVR